MDSKLQSVRVAMIPMDSWPATNSYNQKITCLSIYAGACMLKRVSCGMIKLVLVHACLSLIDYVCLSMRWQ